MGEILLVDACCECVSDGAMKGERKFEFCTSDAVFADETDPPAAGTEEGTPETAH